MTCDLSVEAEGGEGEKTRPFKLQHLTEGGVQNRAQKMSFLCYMYIYIYLMCMMSFLSFSPFGLQKSNFEVTLEENSPDSFRKRIVKVNPSENKSSNVIMIKYNL